MLEEQGWIELLKHENGEWSRATDDERARALDEYRERLFPDLDRVYATVDLELPSSPHGLYAAATEAGKREWRGRHPLQRRDTWKVEGHPSLGQMTVWAIDEKIADSVAGPPSYVAREVTPASFELRTGEIIEGVKVSYRWLNPEATTTDA